ncbi:MAG: amino acid permease-domain-containing protein [Linnemannia gamsii]|nr:MAG: amino acid permease-domain-containing protein [Linnemannia gamsii]
MKKTNPSMQVPPPVHQISSSQVDSDVYPPAYPAGQHGADGTFCSYNEAISFVELYSPKTTMTEPKQSPSKQTLLQRIKRTVAPLQTIATTVTMTSVMTGIVPLAQMTLTSGGPVVMFFGFIFVFLITSTIALSLADIASGFPNVKGGLIEYSRRLAPPRLRRISSWFVGWLHFAAFVTGCSSCAFAFALFTSAAIQIATGYVTQRWITVLIHIIISILFGAINAYNINIDMISVVWHVVGPIIVLLTVATANRNPPSATWVFTHFENQTGWSSSFYVTLVGFSQGAFTMTGYDAPIHTMYNIKNAAWKVPQGIFSGLIVSFTMGILVILTLLYGIVDINAIINPAISGVSAIEIFVHLVGHFGTTCIILIFLGTFFFCGQGIIKACSQIGHELAVSGAFPKSEYLAKLTPAGQPARMGWVCAGISCSIGMLYLFNTTALQALTSAVAIELNLVYSVPIALRLFYPNPTLFQPGPFSLGCLRRPIALIAICWSIFGTVIFSFPGIHPITIDNMNYASVLLLSTVGLIMGYWYFSARHWFDLDRNESEISEKGTGSLGAGLSCVSGKAPSSRSGGAGIGVGGMREGEGELRGMTSASSFSDMSIEAGEVGEETNECDDKDLDEIENWLDHLERDLRSLE